MKIFLIGNGESRKDFDLNLLKEKGLIVGCNAIYRDIKPDILTCMDGKYDPANSHNKELHYGMIVEIREKCNFLDDILLIYRLRYGRRKEQVDLHLEYYREVDTLINTEVKKFHEKFPDEGWASGPSALLVLLRDIFPYHFFIDNVYLIGFDLSRLPTGKCNSYYKDTDNYAPSKSPGTTHDASARQLKQCFVMFRDVNFFRVIQDINNIPREWDKCGNIKNITYEEFLDDIE